MGVIFVSKQCCLKDAFSPEERNGGQSDDQLSPRPLAELAAKWAAVADTGLPACTEFLGLPACTDTLVYRKMV